MKKKLLKNMCDAQNPTSLHFNTVMTTVSKIGVLRDMEQSVSMKEVQHSISEQCKEDISSDL